MKALKASIRAAITALTPSLSLGAPSWAAGEDEAGTLSLQMKARRMGGAQRYPSHEIQKQRLSPTDFITMDQAGDGFRKVLNPSKGLKPNQRGTGGGPPANSEALDKTRNAAHVHVEHVARAERRERLRIGRPVGQLRSELAKIVLEPSRRYDLQYPGGRVACVPKRLPLFARLEDQIARMAGHDGLSEQRPDTVLEDDAQLWTGG